MLTVTEIIACGEIGYFSERLDHVRAHDTFAFDVGLAAVRFQGAIKL
jgi:hypothetical protein